MRPLPCVLALSTALAVAAPACEKTPGDASNSPDGRRGLSFKADEDAGDTAAPVALAQVYGKSHAVVIGIDHYQFVPQLGGAVRDAKEFGQALEKKGFEVTMLLDEQATRGAIAEELGDRLFARVGPNDRVIVFFAGHGFSTGDGDTRMGYLLPIEGRRDAVRATSLSMSELQNWLAGYPAKHVMFLADACYSGLALATRSTGLDPGTASYLQEITTKKVRFTLVAGRDDQEAHEDTQSGHGVFTRFVLEGLDGAADVNRDGLVTSDELSTYVKPQVSTYVSQNFHSSQTPQSARSGMGEFVFFTKTAGGPAPAPAPAPASAPAVAETRPAAAPTSAPTPATTPPPAATPATTPAKPTAAALPEGVSVSGRTVTIETTTGEALRGNRLKQKGSAQKAHESRLRKVLQSHFGRTAATAEAEAKRMVQQAMNSGAGSEWNENDDLVVIKQYTVH